MEGLDAELNGTMSGLVGELEILILEQGHSKDSVGLLKYTAMYMVWLWVLVLMNHCIHSTYICDG